jgi:hypothetical protein
VCAFPTNSSATRTPFCVRSLHFAWRAGTPTELDAELDEMLEQWRALPDGADLTVDWPTTRR